MIIGAGEMGYHLARRLSYEKRNVAVIDRDPERVSFIQSNLDVKVICGRGSSPTVLEEAGIRAAAILVAVTDSDEVNLVACAVAGTLNRFMTRVARLRADDFSKNPQILDKEHLAVDLVINPENEAVKKLIEVLQVPIACDILGFSDGRIKLLGIQLPPESPLVGSSLIELGERFRDQRVLVAAIFRGPEVIIPKGSDVLRARDTVYLMAEKESVPGVIELCGGKGEPLRRVMIWGGTSAGFNTAKKLETLGIPQIRLVESDPARCEEIASELDHTMVLRADSVDEDFLLSEGISDMDAFLAMTGNEEHNALIALLAKTMGARRVAALTSKMEYHRLAYAIGVDVVVNPRLAGASRILQYIRRGKVLSVTMLPGEGVEAIEFEAMATSELVGKPVRKMRFPSGAILGAVERGEGFFIPHGDTVIEPGDRVIAFARRESIPAMEKLLTVKLEFF